VTRELTRVNIQERPVESYEPPQVVDYGDLVELTAGGSNGGCLDADFAAGTKSNALTFSGC
jgi:hypothetical protein